MRPGNGSATSRGAGRGNNNWLQLSRWGSCAAAQPEQGKIWCHGSRKASQEISINQDPAPHLHDALILLYGDKVGVGPLVIQELESPLVILTAKGQIRHDCRVSCPALPNEVVTSLQPLRKEPTLAIHCSSPHTALHKGNQPSPPPPPLSSTRT